MTRDRVLFLIRLLVSAGLMMLLGSLLVREGSAAWPPTIVSPAWLVLAFALLPASVLVRTVNFMILVNARGRVIHLGQATYLTLVGAAANIFLPAGSGDLVKAHVGHRAYGSPEKVVASSIIDKLTSLVSVAVLGVIGGIASGELLLGVISAAVAIGSGVMVAFPQVIPWRFMMRVLAPGVDVHPETLTDATRPSGGLLARVLALSFLGWMLTYAILYGICRSLGIDVTVGYIYTMAPFMTLSTLIPISLGGIGLGQVTLVFLLTRAGFSETLAVQAAFIHLAIIILPAATGAILFAVRGTRERTPTDVHTT